MRTNERGSNESYEGKTDSEYGRTLKKKWALVLYSLWIVIWIFVGASGMMVLWLWATLLGVMLMIAFAIALFGPRERPPRNV